MRYAFHILDVFTDRPFGGNQLAVLPDADGLDAKQMQAVAAEFGFSEKHLRAAAEPARPRLPRAHLHAESGDAVRRPPDGRHGA